MKRENTFYVEYVYVIHMYVFVHFYISIIMAIEWIILYPLNTIEQISNYVVFALNVNVEEFIEEISYFPTASFKW